MNEAKKTLLFSYSANKMQYYIKLMFPFSLPYLFTGLKIAAPMAVTASILIDTLSAKDGIGYKIVYSLYGGGTTGEILARTYNRRFDGRVKLCDNVYCGAHSVTVAKG